MAKEYEVMKNNPGVIFGVCAGNQGTDLALEPRYPACYRLPNVVAVGNRGRNGSRHYTSSYGLPVRDWEPGEAVYSTLPDNACPGSLPYTCEGYMTGTSMAVPAFVGKWIYKQGR